MREVVGGQHAGVAMVGVTVGVLQPAGSRSIRLTPPHPMVTTASAAGAGPDGGLVTIRVTTTDRTEDSEIASVEVEV